MRVLDAVLALTTSVVAEVPSCQQAEETTLLQAKGATVRHGHAESRHMVEETKSISQGREQTNSSVADIWAFPTPELPPFTEPSEDTAAPPPLPQWPHNAMPLQVLDEATYGDVGGRVLDGSMGNYWYGRGTSNLWVIFQDGGGSCNFVEDNPDAQFPCPWWFDGKQRKYRRQDGNGRRNEFFVGNGLLDVDDPNFGDAHHVRVPYLSGDSYLGQVYDLPNGCRPVKDTEDEYETAPWGTCQPYFSGHLLLQNIIHHILSNQPDSRQMTQLLLTGSSAGGRSSIANCDWLQEFMDTHGPGLGMQAVTVSCAPVAGYMMPGNAADRPSPKDPPTPWASWSVGEVTEDLMHFGRVETQLQKQYTNPTCRAAQAPGEEWRCASVYVEHEFVRPRVFVTQNIHDYVHMWMELPSGDFRWVEDRDGPLPDDLRETCQGQKFMGYFGDAMVTSLRERMEQRPDDGLWLASCYDHTRNTRHHGTRIDSDYRTRTTINGYDSLQAVTAWFFHQVDQQVEVIDGCEAALGAPCNPTCETNIQDVSSSCCLSALDDLCGAHNNCLGCAWDNRDALVDAGCTREVAMQACAE